MFESLDHVLDPKEGRTAVANRMHAAISAPSSNLAVSFQSVDPERLSTLLIDMKASSMHKSDFFISDLCLPLSDPPPRPHFFSVLLQRQWEDLVGHIVRLMLRACFHKNISLWQGNAITCPFIALLSICLCLTHTYMHSHTLSPSLRSCFRSRVHATD